MDLHDLCFRHELDQRLFDLYAAPDADKNRRRTIPRDAEAARALLGTVSTLTGHAPFAKIARCALAAHERYLREDGLSFALCRDSALREFCGEGEDIRFLGWAALILETVRVQLGDDAFGPFLRCVIEAESASAAQHAERGRVCV
ncbi:hypothetical protein FH609_023920 [Streptomyces sp. 3MP-14]|uniref:Uncharacterized protein n=1 Tax=Streptomyces mimosae TaxID=2586635 RepID=A0A5N6ADV0_9ACTN|nr:MULTISPECIES: hypothetical protein [Streptomyces]KAB8166405.1 hypothetical protein FH607_011280 [Streptomyces mimosae]KAB8174198.1 hypothetical protein FH609_023920 [Streptomyces sp. 3MP-14]